MATARSPGSREVGAADSCRSATFTVVMPAATFIDRLSAKKPREETRDVRRPVGRVNVARPSRSVALFAVPLATVAPAMGRPSAVTRTTTRAVDVWLSAALSDAARRRSGPTAVRRSLLIEGRYGFHERDCQSIMRVTGGVTNSLHRVAAEMSRVKNSA